MKDLILRPIPLLCIAVLSYGFSNALVRYFASANTGIELAFWLSAGTITGILLARGRRSFKDLKIIDAPHAWPFVVLQASAFLLFVLAMDLASAAIVGAILPFEGIVAAVLAVIFLKEKINLTEGACIAGGALGAGILASSAAGADDQILLGASLALISAALYGGAMILLRKAVETNSSTALAFWACIPVLVISCPFGISTIDANTLTLFAASCLIKPIADLSYTAGVSRAPISLASCTLPMIGMSTAGFAWIMTGETPTERVLLGAAVIAICAIILVRISIKKHKQIIAI